MGCGGNIGGVRGKGRCGLGGENGGGLRKKGVKGPWLIGTPPPLGGEKLRFLGSRLGGGGGKIIWGLLIRLDRGTGGPEQLE